MMLHGGNVWQGGSPDRWLDFSANLRPEGTPNWVKKALREALPDARYYPAPDMAGPRAALAAFAGVPEINILPQAGGMQAIDSVLRLSKGRVAVYAPTFGEYARRAGAMGLNVISARDEGAVRAGDTVFLCNPNNPTGGVADRESVLGLYRRLEAKGARLVVDEAFIDFCPENSVRREAAGSAGLVVLGSLTKTLAIPGVRLGYVIADEKTVSAIERVTPAWSLNCFAARAAEQAPLHLDDMERDRRLNARRRSAFIKALQNLGVRVFSSQSNFLLCDFGRPMDAVTEQLKARGILVRDCESFGLPKSHLRLHVKTPRDNAKLIEALKELM